MLQFLASCHILIYYFACNVSTQNSRTKWCVLACDRFLLQLHCDINQRNKSVSITLALHTRKRTSTSFKSRSRQILKSSSETTVLLIAEVKLGLDLGYRDSKTIFHVTLNLPLSLAHAKVSSLPTLASQDVTTGISCFQC